LWKIRLGTRHQAHDPLINTDQGDLLLFVFLLAGTVGGFAAGYYWRMLLEENKGHGWRKNTKEIEQLELCPGRKFHELSKCGYEQSDGMDECQLCG
jgi:hypothetical protein